MPESSEAIDQTKKPETFLHTVVVDVPTEETQERMTRLLSVLTKVDDIQAQKASRVSDFNAELKQLNKEAHKLRDAITTGKEKRDVECYERPDERRNTVFIVRASDGKVLDERAMTLEDRMYSGKSKAEAEKADQEANGGTDAAADGETGSGGGADEDDGKAGGKSKGGAGKVTRIRASDVKKRKAEREAKEAADKAKKLADEQDAKNAADDDDDSDDGDSDQDDE